MTSADLGVLAGIPCFCGAVVSLARMCREMGDGKLRLAKEIEKELEFVVLLMCRGRQSYTQP